MKISIITVSLNNCKGLVQTFKSIESQTCAYYEWIVIDGGSNDGTKDWLEAHSSEITFWVSEKDNGIYGAMNKGIEAAKGDYYIFLNSGDIFYDDKVLQDFSERDNFEDVIYGKEVGVDSIGDVVWTWNLPKEPLRLSYFWSNTIRHQSTFFKKSCFEKYRYNEEHRINSDVELYLTLYFNKYKFGQFSRIITKFSVDGISSQKGTLELIQKEFRETLERVLPLGVIADYDELMQHRQLNKCDLEIRIKEIIGSNKFLRYVTRLFLYPLASLSRICTK